MQKQNKKANSCTEKKTPPPATYGHMSTMPNAQPALGLLPPKKKARTP